MESAQAAVKSVSTRVYVIIVVIILTYILYKQGFFDKILRCGLVPARIVSEIDRLIASIHDKQQARYG